MKTIKLVLVFCISVIMSSCNIESFDGDVNSGDGGDNGGGESIGDYWPMSVGNMWTYEVTEDGVTQPNSDMEIEGTDNFSGNMYYRYMSFLGDIGATDGTEFGGVSIDVHTRKNGGDYFVKVGDLTANLFDLYLIEQEGYEFTILRDYLNVGDTWTQNFTVQTTFEIILPGTEEIPPVTSNYNMVFEILEKDMTMEVNGVTYSPVIKVKQDFSTDVEGDPTGSTQNDYTYYFAEDVGVIKVEGTLFDADDNITSTILQELVSYSVN